MAVIIYHNPRCSKSRQTLSLLKERGIDPRIVEYLQTPPTAEELRRILGLLGMRPRDLLRKREAKEAGLDDPALDALGGVRSDLMILHARRTKDRSTIAEVNTHPYLARAAGEEWAFCHNGEVRDPSQLSHDGTIVPEGTIDSELLFLHILTRIDAEDTARSVEAIIGEIDDFTSLN